VEGIHQMFYLVDISLSYYAQPLQQILPDQDFWMTAFGRTENETPSAIHVRGSSAMCSTAEVV
jgi:hypothetical protein